ncbi:hypothetical protein CI610_01591 [invertebrate metagenome]|uniref:Uncharacterized protein n=1 Tax=invertebrate metagenome TaxID=1711999 RepID=A0A2H9T8E1_9ZZZZ
MFMAGVTDDNTINEKMPAYPTVKGIKDQTSRWDVDRHGGQQEANGPCTHQQPIPCIVTL